MALAAHQAIDRHLHGIAISWMINSSNLRLAAALESAGLPYTAFNPEPAFRLFRSPVTFLRKTLRTARIFRQTRPNLVMLLQGWIIDGFDGVFPASLAGVPFCSYIPLAHSPIDWGVKRWPRARTLALFPFFRTISRFITIDEQQAIRIRGWRTNAQIAVVENFVPRPPIASLKFDHARQRLRLHAELTVLGVVGRISFWQKAQDWLVNAFADDDFLCDKTLVFIGDGPDSPQLLQLIEASPWRSHIRMLGWCDNLDVIYSALDLLIIPSRAEGVPLVMIEALARHIPVVGSDRDGMKSWLPGEWRFPFGDTAAMKRSIECALSPEAAELWHGIDQRLAIATDERRFAQQFGQALLNYCSPSPG